MVGGQLPPHAPMVATALAPWPLKFLCIWRANSLICCRAKRVSSKLEVAGVVLVPRVWTLEPILWKRKKSSLSNNMQLCSPLSKSRVIDDRTDRRSYLSMHFSQSSYRIMHTSDRKRLHSVIASLCFPFGDIFL